MKKQWFLILIAAMLLLSAAYAETAPAEEPLLYLTFDEGQGAAVRDESGHLQDADIQYQYLTPAYTDPMDPQWRASGVEGG